MKKSTLKNDSKTNFNKEETFQEIADIFDYAEPYYYKHDLYCMFAQTELECNPSNEIIEMYTFYKQQWEHIIEIAYKLFKAKYRSPIKVSVDNLFEARYYSDSAEYWERRTIFLSIEEFKQPGLVFRNVFTSQNQKQLTKKFNEIVMQKDKRTGNNFILDINEFEVYLQLNKVIEALYLIDVREIVHHEGFLKYKYHG